MSALHIALIALAASTIWFLILCVVLYVKTIRLPKDDAGDMFGLRPTPSIAAQNIVRENPRCVACFIFSIPPGTPRITLDGHLATPPGDLSIPLAVARRLRITADDIAKKAAEL